MTRERMSRPSSSCPNGGARLGPSKFSGGFCLRGPYGARYGANMAIRIKTPSTAVPKTARRLEKKALRKSCLRLRVLTSEEAAASCWICASATSQPHSGIEDSIEDVHEQVDQHEEQGSVEDDTLDRSVVPGAYGLVGVKADPRPREDGLRDDGTPHEQSHLQPYNRNGRKHSVPQGVLEDHPPGDDSLGPGRPHVVLAHDLDHTGARHPHHYRHRDGPQSQGGHYQVQDPFPEAGEVQGEEGVDQNEPGYGSDGRIRAESPREREEFQVHAEDHHQDHRQPEDRHAYTCEREDGSNLVE